MPRKSVVELSTPINTAATRRIRPREGTPEAVRAIFAEIVSHVPSEHFRPSDAPLLEQYAQAIAVSRQAYSALEADGPVVDGANGPKANPWVSVLEKAQRSSVALAARLRLAPQSRADPKTVARQSTVPASPYEDL